MAVVDAAALIRAHRLRAGLSQRALAERAGTSAAAICLYERGDRAIGVDTLRRVIEAAGGTLVLDAEPSVDEPIDVEANGRALELVLGLADELPRQSDDELTYPVLRDVAVG